MKKAGPQWTGDVRFWATDLEMPLRLRKPSKIFVANMGDLFYEGFTNEQIAAVFGVMAACQQHTFMVLTKRPERMVEWFKWVEQHGAGYDLLRYGMPNGLLACAHEAVSGDAWADIEPPKPFDRFLSPTPGVFGTNWPLKNVWLGVSTENQAAADERIPLLLQTPAAVRWVSAEPLLGPIDFNAIHGGRELESGAREDWWESALSGKRLDVYAGEDVDAPKLDWVVCGGESGPGARPCDMHWLLSIVDECTAAGVPVFVKQLGARPYLGGRTRCAVKDRKGGDITEFPEELRVRQFPEVQR